MMSKKGLTLLLWGLSLLVFAGAAFAGQVSETTAWQVAQNLMTNHVAVHNSWNGNQAPHPKSINVVNYKGEPVAYLVTAYPSGHVLVAYYDDFSPVLFYSPGSTLDPAKAHDPNAVESWIIPEIYNIIQHLNGKAPVVDQKTKQAILLDISKKNSTEEGARIAAAWKMLNVPSESFTAANKSSVSSKAHVADQTTFASSVGPLTATTWNQGDSNDSNSPYNEYTPAAAGCTHTYTGCVATAMAQVMKYWNWPDTGTGSNSYIWDGSALSADFSHAYNWSSMPIALTSSTTSTQNDAVARLMSDAGISLNMEYGCTGSSADNYFLPLVANSLSTYFKYKSTASHVARSDYAQSSDWMDLIETELNAIPPRVMQFDINVVDNSGHSVVIDGYDTSVSGTEQVHINYGWGGEDTAYYDITNNWTTYIYTWDATDQSLTIGIEPLSGSNYSFSLTILESGAGSGNVTASTGTINWSGNTGTTTYAPNTPVTLTPTAEQGSTFSGWTGCDSVSGSSCTVTTSTNKTVTAAFNGPAAACSYTLTPPSYAFDLSGGAVAFTVEPSSGSCAWTASSNDSWITVTDGSAGTGAGTVVISASPNGSGNTRTGTITAAGQAFIVIQRSAQSNFVPIREFRVPTSGSVPRDITAGPDGNLWFTEQSGNKVGRITPAGVITEFTVPTAKSEPLRITAGPDGNLWFTESGSNKIGQIIPLGFMAGVITEFDIPTANSNPPSITAGPDGNLWFTELNGNKIGQITTAGVITEFPVPTASSGPDVITAGPDGNLWFTEQYGNKIGRITTAGVITEFPVPTASSHLIGIAAGPDGNVWFTEEVGNNIGRIIPAGTITEYAVPAASSRPYCIAAGPDGNLWFTEYYGNAIGQITTAGVISEFTVPTTNSQPDGIAAGPDGNIWFTEYYANKIGQILLGFAPPPSPPSGIWPLSVSTAGAGSGTVTSRPAGINCSSACAASYSTGTSVTLTAIADSGSTFTGWSGACSNQSPSPFCVVTMNSAQAVTAHYVINGTTPFNDVPSGSTYESYIESIYNNGITTGCGNGDYCPSSYVTRDQMAAFLVRATQVAAGQATTSFTCTGGTPGASVSCASTNPYFSDVPATDSFFPYVQKLYELGITTGCGNGDYCPSADVTRDQMAVFLARAFLGMAASGGGNVTGGSPSVSVLAGSTTEGSPVDGTGTAAVFDWPESLVVDGGGNVFVADGGYLRKITPAGIVTTLTLTDSTTGTAIAYPNIGSSIALDSAGNIYAVSGYTIQRITRAGVMSTLAGSGAQGSADGVGTAASFGQIQGIAVDGSGNVYVRDYDANKIRKVTPAGMVSTLAGSGASGSTDGAGAAASFNFGGALCDGIAVDSSGNVYVVEWANEDVRKITPSGVVSTLAGGSGRFGETDGAGTIASFANPYAITVDSIGNVYVVDGTNAIRMITMTGMVSTIYSGSLGPFSAIAMDSGGNFYLTTWGNSWEVLKITFIDLAVAL